MERTLHEQDPTLVGDGDGNDLMAAYDFHLLVLTIIWGGVVNIGLIVPLFRHTVITYYLHAFIMWIVAIFNFAGCFMELVVESGELGDGEDFHEALGIVTLALTLIICVLGIWLRFACESPRIPGWVVRYSRYAHAFTGIGLWACAQMALLSAWWSTNITIFYGLLGYQIAFIIIRSIYRLFPPRI